MEIFARDLADFGKENKSFFIAEAAVVKDFGLGNAQSLMRDAFKDAGLSFKNIYKDSDGNFLFQLTDMKRYYVSLTKRVYEAIEEAQDEATEELIGNVSDKEQGIDKGVSQELGPDLQEGEILR